MKGNFFVRLIDGSFKAGLLAMIVVRAQFTKCGALFAKEIEKRRYAVKTIHLRPKIIILSPECWRKITEHAMNTKGM